MFDVKNTILFGKYEIISSLGTGSFSTVFLSRHIYLECYRAIKRIPKHYSAINSLREAQILRSLHHPNIPVLYDIEQDNDYYYLIEEYVDGESLEDFLLHQTIISQNTFLDITLQLCDIFHFLHYHKPSPILYLDLKPEHIIVCQMTVKLVDFNVSTFISNLGNVYHLFGNTDFSAPELQSGSMPIFQSDIYSIGKIMQFLSVHMDQPLSPNFQKIIHKAIDSDPMHRFETVDALADAVKKEKNFISQPRSRIKIAISGSHCGCGATHLAFALTSTLNYMGYNTIYYQKNPKDDLRHLSSIVRPIKESEGMLLFRYFKGFPLYDEGIRIPDYNADIYIYDYGDTALSDEDHFDHIFYICCNGVWHWHTDLRRYEAISLLHGDLKIICNMGQKDTLHTLSRHFSKPVYHYPYDKDVFVVNKEKITFVSNLLGIKRRNHLFFRLKNAFFPKT